MRANRTYGVVVKKGVPTTLLGPARDRDGGRGVGRRRSLGRPRTRRRDPKSRWTYPDLTVLFENGRVKEVKF